MRKSLIKLLGVIAALMLSTAVSAVGLGGINVTSALGEQLKADIELVEVNKDEKPSLVARLASPDAYKGAGLEYPYDNKFKLQIETRANGDPYLKVSSEQPINDPFVNMLVELTWSSGKLMREYTFLLDPPGYIAPQPAPAPVQAIVPAVQSAPAEMAAKPMEQAAPAEMAAKPAEQAAPAEMRAKPVEQIAPAVTAKPMKQAAPAEAAAKPMKQAAPAGAALLLDTGPIKIQHGDTLSKIAAQYKQPDVSLERMLIALYRANPGQFGGNNINRIRTGTILRLPDQNELMSVTQADAKKEIHAQVADWNAYRQKLASAAVTSSEAQPAQVATGKISSSVADKAPVAKESAKEVLKLSKGEAPGDQAATGAGGKGMSAQDKKNAAQEDAIAKAKAGKEEQARAALLEKNLKDMQRLAELKSEAAAAAAKPSSTAAASSVAAASGVTAASAVKPAPAKPKPQLPKPKVVEAPSLVDQIMGQPLYLAGGAAVLLVLGGVGFVVMRRRKQAPVIVESKHDEEAGVTTARMSMPVAPSPDTGDFTQSVASKAEASSTQEADVDPVSEAELFLNFGRDVQAEEILKEALKNTPDNHQIHLKLLQIYSTRKDAASFSNIAVQLRDSDDKAAWQQAAEMGRKLDPTNSMYGAAEAIEDADSATMQVSALKATPDVDFNLGAAGAGTGAASSTKGMSDIQAAGMDFNIAAPQPSAPATGGKAEASPDVEGMVFDVTASQPSMKAAQPEAAKPADEMTFTLNLPDEEVAEKPAPKAPPAEVDLAEINLDFGGVATPGAAEGKDEHWHEVATKLDLAKAYQEMSDVVGAREILEEVLREGDAEQREAAQALLDKLG